LEAPYLGSEYGVMEEKPTSKQNPLELKERAVRMVREIRSAALRSALE